MLLKDRLKRNKQILLVRIPTFALVFVFAQNHFEARYLKCVSWITINYESNSFWPAFRIFFSFCYCTESLGGSKLELLLWSSSEQWKQILPDSIPNIFKVFVLAEIHWKGQNLYLFAGTIIKEGSR